MTLKNVEVIEQPQQKQSWFEKFRGRATSAAVVASTALVASAARAEGEGIPDFLAPAKDSLGGIAVSLGALFVIAIGITLVVIAFTNSRGGIKKAG
ncbi:hypothetical protein [Acinetobacter courvalinii]|uniref:hypothetical protein n=1 Tax=Acinetobacter courvalinii TaxID=280147 RepID=UPI0002CDEDAA|nr:hypothetical protein [Acinetobacter courvalinii]ENX04614.1 hypothetical protein F898_03754 [Acinetobacter courvalinii]